MQTSIIDIPFIFVTDPSTLIYHFRLQLDVHGFRLLYTYLFVFFGILLGILRMKVSWNVGQGQQGAYIVDRRELVPFRCVAEEWTIWYALYLRFYDRVDVVYATISTWDNCTKGYALLEKISPGDSWLDWLLLPSAHRIECAKGDDWILNIEPFCTPRDRTKMYK